MKNRFYTILSCLALGLFAASAAALRAEPVISEFMASNVSTLQDEDGAYSDWIEIYNPDPTPADLTGWYLTDTENNKTRWQFPATMVPARGYIVIFASNKNRVVSGQELHTNFALSANGEYLGLIKPDGISVASEFAPTYPAQKDDVSYGRPLRSDGTLGNANFLSPTPGRDNPSSSNNTLAETITFSRRSGTFSNILSLEITGASEGQVIRYTISGPDTPAARLGNPNSNSPRYTGPIALSTSTTIRAAVFAADGSGRGAYATATFSKIDSSVSGFSSHLPVVVIDTMGSGALEKDNVDHPAWMYLYASRDGTAPTFRGTPEISTPLTATVRGSSSAEFPKKGYNLKLTDEQGNKRGQELLGMASSDRWALVGPWSFDRNYINNALAYALSNRIGRWAPSVRFVEVYMDDNGDSIGTLDYIGVYLLTERIEPGENRVDIPQLTASDVSGSAVTGGYILKFDEADPDEFGWVTRHGIPNTGTESLVLVSPKSSDMATQQRDYIMDYVQRMEDALYSDRAASFAHRAYTDYLDRSAWVDHHILQTFSANPDALIRSAFFTKDRDGKLMAGPVWDFDRAFGSFADERSYRYDVWFGLGATDTWDVGWWGLLARDPEFMQDWVDRWQQLRDTAFANDNLWTLIDSLAAQVGNDAAVRDAARWTDNANPFDSYSEQIQYLKGWLTNRARWIDDQFVARPAAEASGGQLVLVPAEGAQLVYTLDGSDPRSLGGEIAPNAIVSNSAVSVTVNANVHARSYKASLKGTFPGSPWSSVATGVGSSPLSPASRLVNISSRATVGSGENALIAGVVVTDTDGKRYLSRAIGPGLGAFGATGVVPDPQLSIFGNGGSELFRNTGWETGLDAAQIPSYSKSVGAFPLNPGSRDSALASQLNSGAYTVQVSTPTGQNGIGLAELYELDRNGRTVNLSTRAHVAGGDGVLIGGFVVQGSAYKRMLIRAVGPTLAGFGLDDALRNPVLTLYSGSTVVASNDHWEANENTEAIKKATTVTGAFNLTAGSEDAALLITLPPGAYTVEVKGGDNGEGVALLEIYEVP